MKALSIRQPWAWLILNGGKDIENRTWKTAERGRIIVHAAKNMTRDDYHYCQLFVGNAAPEVLKRFPAFEDLKRGGIVGTVEIVDCVRKSDSPWFDGPYGFVLANPEECEFKECKGSLQFFDPDNLPPYKNINPPRSSSGLPGWAMREIDRICEKDD